MVDGGAGERQARGAPNRRPQTPAGSGTRRSLVGRQHADFSTGSAGSWARTALQKFVPRLDKNHGTNALFVGHKFVSVCVFILMKNGCVHIHIHDELSGLLFNLYSFYSVYPLDGAADGHLGTRGIGWYVPMWQLPRQPARQLS